MAITQCIPDSFRTELLSGTHNLAAAGDTIKVALYTSAADLGPSTTAYTATNEVSGTGYSAGGATVSGQAVAVASNTGYWDFNDVTWAGSTITARGAMIYNSSKSNKVIAILDFGSDKSSSASTFTIQLPAATASTAILRI